MSEEDRKLAERQRKSDEVAVEECYRQIQTTNDIDLSALFRRVFFETTMSSALPPEIKNVVLEDAAGLNGGAGPSRGGQPNGDTSSNGEVGATERAHMSGIVRPNGAVSSVGKRENGKASELPASQAKESRATAVNNRKREFVPDGSSADGQRPKLASVATQDDIYGN
ncbi:Protein CBG28011 [Caenorhabditis briggsae]|uniref:Uncharacterized protein n=2 Tax=Caenorhabditis briggsae TaxID=6238 RepID=A0AAE9FKV3_CAEBR|nr:Protein CBG28011 [Caenorhabditis briggsae]ULT84206.1 hypothetical protein L3Y34_013089 [Caenorhabditis briggsae]UMM43448.1 hypothetical protein L5515_018937 [Caenorhabditis briggsae]CAR98837.1 Protein CBG28011 [Caenorhabditis briggsae]